MPNPNVKATPSGSPDTSFDVYKDVPAIGEAFEQSCVAVGLSREIVEEIISEKGIQIRYEYQGEHPKGRGLVQIDSQGDILVVTDTIAAPEEFVHLVHFITNDKLRSVGKEIAIMKERGIIAESQGMSPEAYDYQVWQDNIEAITRIVDKRVADFATQGSFAFHTAEDFNKYCLIDGNWKPEFRSLQQLIYDTERITIAAFLSGLPEEEVENFIHAVTNKEDLKPILAKSQLIPDGVDADFAEVAIAYLETLVEDAINPYTRRVPLRYTDKYEQLLLTIEGDITQDEANEADSSSLVKQERANRSTALASQLFGQLTYDVLNVEQKREILKIIAKEELNNYGPEVFTVYVLVTKQQVMMESLAKGILQDISTVKWQILRMNYSGVFVDYGFLRRLLEIKESLKKHNIPGKEEILRGLWRSLMEAETVQMFQQRLDEFSI